MRPVIHSKKHIQQIAQQNVSQGAVVLSTILEAQEGPSTTPSQVIEGATVKSCYVEYWVQNDSTSAIGSFTVILYKNPGNGQTANATDLAALHDWENKKNIFFTSQALAPSSDSMMIPVMRGWYKIPKGKQRMGLKDKIQIAIRNNNASAVDIEFCGLAIFKEYT